MSTQQHSDQAPKDKPAPQPQLPQQNRGRSGEGSGSVLPHLKADMRARAVARIAKRAER